MATAHAVLATAQISVTNLQNENRQNNRKRKQNMPLGAALPNGTVASSSTVNQEPLERVPQENADKSLSASISAVTFFSNIPEEKIRSCALDLKKSGKAVNSRTLLEECELRYPEDTPQLQSYTERVNSNINIASSESVSIGTSAYTSGACATTADPLSQNALSSTVPAPSSIHHSLQSTSIGCGSSSRTTQHSNSRHSREGEHSGARGNNSHSSTISHLPFTTVSNFFVQSEEATGDEDCTDGLCLSLTGGFNDSLNQLSYSSSESPNGLSRPGQMSYLTSLTTITPLAAENTISNLAGHDSASTNKPHAGRSYVPQTSRANYLCVLNDSADVKDIAAENRLGNIENNVAFISEMQESLQQGQDITPLAIRSSQSNAEYTELCFKLVEKENKLLEKSRLCSQCSSRPRDVTFLPCGHFTFCRTCAEPIYVCPCCNKSILATVDTFLS